MGVKSGLKKFSGGANLAHPKLTVWGVLGIVASVIAILVGIELGKYLLGKSKRVVSSVVPGAGGGMGDIRGSMGI